MYNLIPGQGLGFTGSKEIAFGLGGISKTVVEKVYAAAKYIFKVFRG